MTTDSLCPFCGEPLHIRQVPVNEDSQMWVRGLDYAYRIECMNEQCLLKFDRIWSSRVEALIYAARGAK